jgi:hypothetical protein
VGEYLGHDTDCGIWGYFKTHWLHFFPHVPDRSNFARQAANLHHVKRLLQERIDSFLGAYHDQLHMIDGLPMPVCKFAQAHFSRVFKGDAAYGYCATKKERYYGFRGHILINSIGVVTAATFTKAIERIRARNLWHQASRFWRKLLAHTVCIRVNIDQGNEPLQLEGLVVY